MIRSIIPKGPVGPVEDAGSSNDHVYSSQGQNKIITDGEENAIQHSFL